MRYGYRDLPWRDEVARELGLVGDPFRAARASVGRGIEEFRPHQPDAPHRAMTHRGIGGPLEGFGQLAPGSTTAAPLPGVLGVIGSTLQAGVNLYTQARDAALGRSANRTAIALAQAQTEQERARVQLAQLESQKTTRFLLLGGGVAVAALFLFTRRRRR